MKLRKLCCLLGLTLTLTACGTPKPVNAEFFAMDTLMSISAYGERATETVTAAQHCIQELEQELSRTRADSLISQINDAEGEAVRVDESVAGLLSAAIQYSAGTEGAFDCTVAPLMDAWGFAGSGYRVPSEAELHDLQSCLGGNRIALLTDGDGVSVQLDAGQSIDLGGIAKGYASDRVAALFREAGIESGILSLGGNVYACGSRPDGSAWRVAVQDPANREGYLGVLSLEEAYAVTSGGYQRYFEQDGQIYHHILDPKTGKPAQSGFTSVTIVAKGEATEEPIAPSQGTLCDALSTAVFVMGEEKASALWRSGKYPFEMVCVTEDGRILVTAGLEERFTVEEGNGYAVEYLR